MLAGVGADESVRVQPASWEYPSVWPLHSDLDTAVAGVGAGMPQSLRQLRKLAW